VFQAGQTVVKIFNNRSRRLTLNAGIESYFITGSTSVYPGAGFSVGISYTTPLFGFWPQVSAKYLSLSANERPISGFLLELIFNL
jgi:hypothetical protein